MIFVFNWKDKLPKDINLLLSYYRILSKKHEVIICPPLDKLIQINLKNFSICLQRYVPELVDKADYIMLNHERFKEKYYNETDYIPEILNSGKKIIFCFSSFKEIIDWQKFNCIWAYEPTENIGTNKDLDKNSIISMFQQLQENNFKKPYLYGGGVNKTNIKFLIDLNINGVLIGDKSVETDWVKSFIEELRYIGVL